MRKILFRGQDIYGKWHYGLLAHIGNAWYISNEAGVPTAYEVIPETVGQYTGSKNKNGTKIFEGDILEFIDDDNNEISYYEVAYSEADCRWIIRQNRREIDDLDDFFKKYMTVVGNIYDNLELLEV